MWIRNKSCVNILYQWNWILSSNKYSSLIEEIVLPYLGLEEALVQIYPTFRVHLPNNVAIVIKHYDSDENHKHPYGEN